MDMGINCFKWQNQLSDYLDHSLPQALEKEINDHFNQCKKCHALFKHYQILMTQITELSFSPLPSELKKKSFSHFSGLFHFFTFSSRWKLPWYLQIFFKLTFFLGGIFFILSIAPNIHEWLKKFFTLFNSKKFPYFF